MRGYLCRLRTAERTARPQPKSIWRCREGSCGQLRTRYRCGCRRTDPTTEGYGCRAGQNRTPSSASSRSSGNVRDTRRWKVVATQRGPGSPPVRSTRTESRHERSSSLVGSEARSRSMASILRAPAGSATALAARTQTPRGPSRVLIVTSTRQVMGMPARDGRGIGAGEANPGGPAAPRDGGSCKAFQVYVHSSLKASDDAGFTDLSGAQIGARCHMSAPFESEQPRPVRRPRLPGPSVA